MEQVLQEWMFKMRRWRQPSTEPRPGHHWNWRFSNPVFCEDCAVAWIFTQNTICIKRDLLNSIVSDSAVHLLTPLTLAVLLEERLAKMNGWGGGEGGVMEGVPRRRLRGIWQDTAADPTWLIPIYSRAEFAEWRDYIWLEDWISIDKKARPAPPGPTPTCPHSCPHPRGPGELPKSNILREEKWPHSVRAYRERERERERRGEGERGAMEKP